MFADAADTVREFLPCMADFFFKKSVVSTNERHAYIVYILEFI